MQKKNEVRCPEMMEKKGSQSDARACIISRVKEQLAATRAADRGVLRKTAEALIAARQRGPQPALASDLRARFVRSLILMSCTVEQVDKPSEIPAAVGRYLVANGLGQQAVASPQLADLDWVGANLTVNLRAAQSDDLVGITGCYSAIAETGTLMLVSGTDTPPSVSLLPETHIALLKADAIVPTLEDALARLRREFGTIPPAINFISGPSRTADIEQTIVLGAHGPCRVHVVLLASQ